MSKGNSRDLLQEFVDYLDQLSKRAFQIRRQRPSVVHVLQQLLVKRLEERGYLPQHIEELFGELKRGTVPLWYFFREEGTDLEVLLTPDLHIKNPLHQNDLETFQDHQFSEEGEETEENESFEQEEELVPPSSRKRSRLLSSSSSEEEEAPPHLPKRPRLETFEEEVPKNTRRVYETFSRIEKDLGKVLMRTPFIGYNSSMYDLNVWKRDILPILVDKLRGGIRSTVKRQNAFMSSTTDKFIFLNVQEYLAPGYSYAKDLEAYEIDAAKGEFSYESFTSLEKLEETELSPKEAFFFLF